MQVNTNKLYKAGKSIDLCNTFPFIDKIQGFIVSSALGRYLYASCRLFQQRFPVSLAGLLTCRTFVP
jgi:hypothetical protein